VNIGIGLIYLALLGWGIASLLFIPIHPNIDWPISAALAYVIVIFLVHFIFIAIGALLVPDYVYYPVKPEILYILADLVIFFSFVGVVASYILSSLSSSVPLFGLYLIILSLCIHLYKLYSLVWGRASKTKSATGEVLLSGGA